MLPLAFGVWFPREHTYFRTLAVLPLALHLFSFRPFTSDCLQALFTHMYVYSAFHPWFHSFPFLWCGLSFIPLFFLCPFEHLAPRSVLGDFFSLSPFILSVYVFLHSGLIHAFAHYFLVHWFLSLCTYSFNTHRPFAGRWYVLAGLVQYDGSTHLSIQHSKVPRAS